jgi:hypothetical protein
MKNVLLILVDHRKETTPLPVARLGLNQGVKKV